MTKFRDFVGPSGRNQIEAWYAEQSESVQADMDTTLLLLDATEIWQWPQWDTLHGKQKGLGEIRWATDKVQYRLIAFREDETCTLLIGCTHKQRVYKPANALDSAVKRRRQLELGEATTCEHDSKEENDLGEARKE